LLVKQDITGQAIPDTAITITVLEANIITTIGAPIIPDTIASITALIIDITAGIR
jgi:hypothetical protein